MLSSAAGARVQADISARGLHLIEDRIEQRFERTTAATLDDAASQGTMPSDVLEKGCKHPRISCSITDFVLLKPELYVLSANKPELSHLVGAKLIGLRTKFTGKELERLTEGHLERNLGLPSGTTLRYRNLGEYGLDSDTDDFGGKDEEVAIIYYQGFSGAREFMRFWKSTVDAIESDASDAAVDKIMYHAIVAYKYRIDHPSYNTGMIVEYPWFIRNVAKQPVDGWKNWLGADNKNWLGADSKQSFLGSLIRDSKQNGGPRYPLFMDLLTDPEIYKDKKWSHKFKRYAEQFQKTKKKKVRSKAETTKANEEKIDAIFEQIPDQLEEPTEKEEKKDTHIIKDPTDAAGALYSSKI